MKRHYLLAFTIGFVSLFLPIPLHAMRTAPPPKQVPPKTLPGDSIKYLTEKIPLVNEQLNRMLAQCESIDDASIMGLLIHARELNAHLKALLPAVEDSTEKSSVS